MHHDSTRCVNHPTWHAMTPGGLVSGLFAPSCKWKSGKFMAVSRTVSMADKWMEGANSAKKGNDAFFFSLLWSKNGRVTCLKALLYRSQEYVWAFPYMPPRIAFRCKISEITLSLDYVSLIFVLFPTQTIKAFAQPGRQNVLLKKVLWLHLQFFVNKNEGNTVEFYFGFLKG